VKRLALLMFTTLMFVIGVSAQTITVSCVGSAAMDTAAIQSAINSIGTGTGTITLPRDNDPRCVVNDLIVPSNITMDFGLNSAGVQIVTSKILSIGSLIARPDQQLFFNALAGQGTVNLSVSVLHPEWWTANVNPGVTDMTAAINAAIQACPHRRAARLQILGGYLLSGSGTELILVDRNVSLVGVGAQSSRLIPSTSVGSSTRVIRVVPDGDTRFLSIADLSIQPPSGTGPAGYGIDLDVSGFGSLANLSVEHCYFERLGSSAIHLTNPAARVDGFFSSDIRNNFIVGSIDLVGCGDSIKVRDNIITGAQAGIGITFGGLAATGKSIIDGNSITTAGGAINVLSGDKLVISNNNIEQVFTYTGTLDALINLEGSAAARILHANITNNTINSLGRVVNLVRINYADRTVLQDNDLQKSPGPSVVITENARNTDPRAQAWGDPYEVSIADSGVGTYNVSQQLTLASGWVNNGFPVDAASSTKTSDNRVHLHGLIITDLSPPSLGFSLTTLPVGHRPADTVYCPVFATSNGKVVTGSIHITAGGVIVLDSGPTAFHDGIVLEIPPFKASDP